MEEVFIISYLISVALCVILVFFNLITKDLEPEIMVAGMFLSMFISFIPIVNTVFLMWMIKLKIERIRNKLFQKHS